MPGNPGPLARSYLSMALETLITGLLIGAEAASSNQTDIKMGAGRIS